MGPQGKNGFHGQGGTSAGHSSPGRVPMTKHVCFLVHGIGQHGDGWSATPGGPVAALAEVAAAYPGYGERPLADTVEFVEVRYDDLFDLVLERWQTLAGEFDGLPLAQKVKDTLARHSGPLGWFAREAMDVLLYTHFDLVRRAVQLKVAARMMRAVADRAADEDVRYVLLAHSLGTTVAHDAVHRLGTAEWLDRELLQELATPDDPMSPAHLAAALERYGPNPFAPGNLKFSAVFMLANTSPLLHRDTPDPGRSIVRPLYSPGLPQGNACLTFYNADHRWDPVTKVKPFRAERAWPTSARFRTTQDLADLAHVHDLNVHGFRHYLLHPRVHAPLLAACDPTRFTNQSFALALARTGEGGDFPDWAARFRATALRERLIGALEALVPPGGGWEQLVSTLLAMPLTLERLGETLGGGQ